MELNTYNIAFGLYLLATIFYGANAFSRKSVLSKLGALTLMFGFLLLTIFLGQRWKVAGRPPLSNMYESMIIFAWAIAIVYLVLERAYKYGALGFFATLVGLLSLGYASLLDRTIEPLMPALQSNWLTIHVATCFMGYAALGISYVAAVIFFLKKKGLHRNLAVYHLCFVFVSVTILFLLLHYGKLQQFRSALSLILLGLADLVIAAVVWIPVSFLLNLIKFDDESGPKVKLDDVVYKLIAFGFLFLAVGIITGAVWANETWGTYWSWDPKETWSLVTWFVYAIYLHARLGMSWRGEKLTWLAMFGFTAVIFTYIGVNYLLSGLHSYA